MTRSWCAARPEDEKAKKNRKKNLLVSASNCNHHTSVSSDFKVLKTENPEEDAA